MIDLGHLPYEPAYQAQLSYLDRVIAARNTTPIPGFLLLVEHDPVITISRRAGAANHLIATPQLLAQHGVAIAETDRGGDITYHGPGQLVAYPILDLNALNLGLHAYMRLLEQAVIDTCAHFQVPTHRDPTATGVWTTPALPVPLVGAPQTSAFAPDATHLPAPAKIAAMGVRVRRWISLHGLALNVSTNLDHFQLIVPCGLHRPVTSLQKELGQRAPTLAQVKPVLTSALTTLIHNAWNSAQEKREHQTSSLS